MPIQYLSRSSIRGKRVLVRVDFNVPVVQGSVHGDFRIRAHIPTIRALRRRGNSVILLSHHSNTAQSLRPMAKALGTFLRVPVVFVANPLAKNRKFVPPSTVVLIENLRRWKGEEALDMSFARSLADWGDVFLNDAFSVAHRRAASTVLLPRLLPAFLGPLFSHELEELDHVMRRPRRPLVAIFGGAKTETKLPLLRRFSRLADSLIVGGAIANTVLVSQGSGVGASKVDTAALRSLKSLARSRNIIVPVDAVVSNSDHTSRARIIPVWDVSRGDTIWDVGPASSRLYRALVMNARTIVWNGPLGLVEHASFQGGTRALAQSLRRSRAKVIIGGGDTVAFLESIHMLEKFKHVSTGGGAMLAYLGGEKLPGLEALRQSKI